MQNNSKHNQKNIFFFIQAKSQTMLKLFVIFLTQFKVWVTETDFLYQCFVNFEFFSEAIDINLHLNECFRNFVPILAKQTLISGP